MLTGIFSTLLIKETKQLSLEELSNENQEGFMASRPVNATTTSSGSSRA